MPYSISIVSYIHKLIIVFTVLFSRGCIASSTQKWISDHRTSAVTNAAMTLITAQQLTT